MNIHGYFAGGGMYWRESARLAEQIGWRVINPSLPGFGGSDPLEWQDVSIENLANQVMAIVHKVDAGPVVLLGHSMGGAVAVQFAHDHPRRTLGVIYRDGVSTPAWKERTGIIPTLLSPFLPDVAPMVDMIAAVVFDLPDLAIGRMYSTVRAVLPDMRQNIRTVSQTLPVGSMLMGVDQRSEVRHLVAQQIPILNEWGCFDRITPGPHRAGVRRHRALTGAVGAGRPQLDAGSAPGSGRHPHPPRPGTGVHGAGGDPLAPAHSTRIHAAAPSTDGRGADGPAAPTAVGHDRGRPVISRLLQPLLSLHGWQAYALVGLLVFAEDAVMLGFVFPGETAAILGGVLASKGGVNLGGIVAVVVVCAIVGDSVGYAIGDRWGHQLLQLGPLRKRQKGIASALDQLSRRGRDRRLRGPLLRLPARRDPGARRHVQAALPRLPARQRRRRRLLGRPLRTPRVLRRGASREGDRYRVRHPARPDRRGRGRLVRAAPSHGAKREIEGPAEAAAPSEDSAG